MHYVHVLGSNLFVFLLYAAREDDNVSIPQQATATHHRLLLHGVCVCVTILVWIDLCCLATITR